MPSSATRTFTDPDSYFAGIRNLQIDGVITGRGKFRAESTRIDLHRLENQRLYASIGYEETERGTEAGYERVFMRKRLRDAMPRCPIP
jgi:hypothetical protein